MRTSTVVPGLRRRIAAIVSAKAARSAVGEVVAGHGGDDRVGEPHPGDRLGDAVRLARIERERAARVDQAEAASSRAALAVDHERRGAVGPALEDVRAAGLLADRDEVELAHRRAEPEVAPARSRASTRSPLGLAARDAPRPRAGSTPAASSEPAVERPLERDRYAGRGARAPRPSAPPRSPATTTTSWRSTRRARREPSRAPGARSPRRRRASSRSTPSAASEVTPRSVSPQGTMWPNMTRSGSTFSAKPCIVPPAADPHADGADLARLRAVGVDPDARVAVEPAGPASPRSPSASMTSCSIACT